MAWLGAVLVVATGLIALTVQIGWCPGVPVAVLQLLLPWCWVLTIVVSVGAAVGGSWPLVVTGCVVAAATLVVLLPKLRRTRRSRAADPTSPTTLSVTLANLYIDNPEPEAAVQQLLQSGTDILVMTELSTELLELFDALGGAKHFPNRVHPEPLDGEYEVGIFSSLPFEEASVGDRGVLQVVDATVRCPGSQTLRVIAVHPEAPVSRRAFRCWRSQLAELRALLGEADGPTIALGDLNGGSLQPPYERLLDRTFRDAHDELGVALRPSWGIAPWFPRWFPTLLARLDHLLISPEIVVASLEDLDAVGSDHRPFRARLVWPPPSAGD